MVSMVAFIALPSIGKSVVSDSEVLEKIAFLKTSIGAVADDESGDVFYAKRAASLSMLLAADDGEAKDDAPGIIWMHLRW